MREIPEEFLDATRKMKYDFILEKNADNETVIAKWCMDAQLDNMEKIMKVVFDYQIAVEHKAINMDEASEWIGKNCHGAWQCTPSYKEAANGTFSRTSHPIFWFQELSDATYFKMAWF